MKEYHIVNSPYRLTLCNHVCVPLHEIDTMMGTQLVYSSGPLEGRRVRALRLDAARLGKQCMLVKAIGGARNPEEARSKSMGIFGAYLLEGAMLIAPLRETVLLTMQLIKTYDLEAAAQSLVEELYGCDEDGLDDTENRITIAATKTFLMNPTWQGYVQCLFRGNVVLPAEYPLFRSWSILRPRISEAQLDALDAQKSKKQRVSITDQENTC